MRVQASSMDFPPLVHGAHELGVTTSDTTERICVPTQIFGCLDAECSTISAPRLRGCWLTGVANVLSTQTMEPHVSFACFANRAMSTTFSVGFVGVSRYSNVVCARCTDASMAAKSDVSTRSTSTPNRGRYFRNSSDVPPYESFIETTRSPGFNSAKSVLEIAAMPEAKAIESSAPSNAWEGREVKESDGTKQISADP
jgi:hypothetical protein